MAEDQFQSSGGNWWDSAGRNNNNNNNNNNMRYESGGGASQSSSSGNNNFANWQQQQDHHVAAEHMKPTARRSSMDSSGGSSVVFHHHDPHHPPDHSSDPNLHMMALGLSSPSSLDWDQPSLLRGEKGGENSFRSMVQENLGSSRTNFQQDHHHHHHHHHQSGGMGMSPQQVQWRDPSSTVVANNNSNSNSNNRGFSLEQNQFSPQYSSGDSTVTSQQGLHHHPSSISSSSSSSPFHNIDSSALYASPSSILMQGLLGPPDQSHSNQQANHNSLNFPFPSMSYGLSSNTATDLVPPPPPNSWPNNKAPQLFLRSGSNNHLHFTNNAPFWNASSEASATIKDVRSTGFFPSLQTPFSTTPTFDVQSKNMSEVRDSGGVVKKSGSEQTPKRPRNETPSPLPAFKVRKEKMGDRITALQQLVSPFGKTDTASVLSEAIEYIKFLHEQVTVLSTPYMKSGAPIQIQQSKEHGGEGPKQDLRSRGLCLVPVSSTFPVTHETTVDFWTPTFGGGSR